MSSDRHPGREATRAAAALSTAFAKSETDLDSKIDGMTKDLTILKLDVAGAEGELVLHRWTPSFVPATNVAILFKIFVHSRTQPVPS